MINTYKPTEGTSISSHFSISEFKCKCGGNHDTKVDSDLVSKLETLRTNLSCSKIVINSGYRCPTHDKNVGGSGSGPHCKGVAADIVCYDQNGNKISSKKVCCAAQDIGFNGIANIDKTYTATHVDVDNRKWYGDETITTAYSITNDFYSYYGVAKSNKTAKKTKTITLTVDGVTYSGTLTEK